MPSTVRQRTGSSEIAQKSKRHKSHHISSRDYSSCFAAGLLEDTNIERLNREYRESKPFLHAVVNELFEDSLLTHVKNECIGELSFTEKQTDIYRVFQTGDLASLSYLTKDQIALLPNLLKLRDALYSEKFRSFLRKVTGCGPLSGKQQDMSVNSYRKGCHLLNHDDVIGTRRVSYILYMPLPKDKSWRAEWGGALELYPVKSVSINSQEPEPTPSKIIPPSWNQFVFFEVQPGHSFHSVEEVVVDEDDCQRQRLSISGWFHKPQRGEAEFEEEEARDLKSSLEQLTSTSTAYVPYADEAETTSDSFLLSEEHISFLSAFIDPIYLRPDVLGQICQTFVDESTLDLKNFLCEPISTRLEVGLRARDKADGLDGESRTGKTPAHIAGAEGSLDWVIRGPPHRFRYCTLSPASQEQKADADAFATLSSAESSADEIMNVLRSKLLPSLAFRSWLKLAAKVITTGYSVEARRFRPGLDYTLATSNDEESILDVVLHLTPEASLEKSSSVVNKKGKNKAADRESDEDDGNSGWLKGDWGGWECYMSPHEGEEDPAVYRSGPKKQRDPEQSESANHERENGHGQANSAHEEEDDKMSDGEGEVSDEDEDDGTLLTVLPEFNRLSLVLREKGVLRFVKYVSASAPGSRWDVSGEYTVSVPDDDDDDDDDDDGDEEESGMDDA